MKYIVYLTINVANNYIYIGSHAVSNSYNFDGYLGEGVYINYPSTYKYSKTNFQLAVNQFGVKNFKRITLAEFDSEKEAQNLENLLVTEEFLSRPDVYNTILGRIPNNFKSSKCYRYTKTGEFDKEFDNIEEAAKESNVLMMDIYKSAMLGYTIGEFCFLFEKADNYSIGKTNSIKNRKVYKYDSFGNYLCDYDSQTSAEKDNKYSNINRSIKTKKPCKNGFLWGLEKLDRYCFNEKDKRKRIGKFDSSNNLIETYESVKECCQQNNISSSFVAIGKQNGNFAYKCI